MKIANRIVANAMAANAAVDDEEVAEEKFGNAADKFIKGLKSVDAGLKECAKVSGQMANLFDKYPAFFDGGASSFRGLVAKLMAAGSAIESFMSRM